MIPVVKGAAAPHESHEAAPKAALKVARSSFAEMLDAHAKGPAKANKKRDGKAAKSPSPIEKKDLPVLVQLGPPPVVQGSAAVKKHAAAKVESKVESQKPKLAQPTPPQAPPSPAAVPARAEAPISQPAQAKAEPQVAEVKVAAKVAAPPPPPPIDLPNDPGLSLSLMPRAAHFQLKTEDHGNVRLHLRVRDGVADVRIDGAPQVFGPQQAQLRSVLAAQGLELGAFELPQRREEPANVPDRDQPAPQRTAARSHSATRHAGRIDVEA